MNKPETVDEYKIKMRDMISLLIECRDALPAINMVSARLHNVSLSLDDRIKSCLEPWEIKETNPPKGGEDK